MVEDGLSIAQREAIISITTAALSSEDLKARHSLAVKS